VPHALEADARLNAAHRRDANAVLVDSFLDECVDCGNEDPDVLEFDHVFGTKMRHVTGLVGGGRPTLLREIAKCEVRCANCHTKRHKKVRRG
jgi:hypothetical protein